jgi:hypothetical protein
MQHLISLSAATAIGEDSKIVADIALDMHQIFLYLLCSMTFCRMTFSKMKFSKKSFSKEHSAE